MIDVIVGLNALFQSISLIEFFILNFLMISGTVSIPISVYNPRKHMSPS